MDTKRSYKGSVNEAAQRNIKSKDSTKARQDCIDSSSSSHTHIFKENRLQNKYVRITSDEYLGIQSDSGSSDSFGCVHGAQGRSLARLEKNFIKQLDRPTGSEGRVDCPALVARTGWEVAATLEFLVHDPVANQNTERLRSHLRDLATVATSGYRIDVLNSVTAILEYLVENVEQTPCLRGELILLLEHLKKPILLTTMLDIETQQETLRKYFGFLGYLLMRMEQDDLFELVGGALLWQLAADAAARPPNALCRRHALAAASALLPATAARMLAIAPAPRFLTFLQMALLLACHSVHCCIDMMKENIIENIFYRFNPYFPVKLLPDYEENPLNPQDCNVKLGASSVHMSTTLSLLLVLMRTLKTLLDENSDVVTTFPCPDYYAQRCYLWAYRYECRARGRRHERMSLTVIAHALLHCFGERLTAFSSLLMPDVLSLSVLTEVPPRQLWLKSVGFNTSQSDALFKNNLIYFSVDLLKTFPHNKFMVESQHWLLGVMFLLDPGLCHLRARWSPALYAELRRTALQALVCTLHFVPSRLIAEYEIIRRILWYIEWYTESPFELHLLYWCVRLLYATLLGEGEQPRAAAMEELFDTHGVIILMHLCHTLLEQRCPPVEKSQVVLALTLRLLRSAAAADKHVSCCVYPLVLWPTSVDTLAAKMTDIVLYSLDKHLLISDRWIISLLDLIWEAIIWRKEYREKFILKNGVYNLLDLITLCKPPVQCLCLAMLSDLLRAGRAVAQLITWRASLTASSANPRLVKRGATIASLLATVFREECLARGAPLNECGVLQDLDCPLMSTEVRKELKNPELCTGPHRSPFASLVVADMAGSRMSKAFAILHILSEDLQHKVALADEAYKMYKNVKLKGKEETVLLLCAHYLTLKLNETWLEAKAHAIHLLPTDEEHLDEFIEITRGWAKEIKRQQEDVIRKHNQKEVSEEESLYVFLARVRLNIALDALREVRCGGRTHAARHRRLPYVLPQPAVPFGHTIIATYRPPLDDMNPTGQYVKVRSIPTNSTTNGTSQT